MNINATGVNLYGIIACRCIFNANAQISWKNINVQQKPSYVRAIENNQRLLEAVKDFFDSILP